MKVPRPFSISGISVIPPRHASERPARGCSVFSSVEWRRCRFDDPGQPRPDLRGWLDFDDSCDDNRPFCRLVLPRRLKLALFGRATDICTDK